jgi:hypothetical protein
VDLVFAAGAAAQESAAEPAQAKRAETAGSDFTANLPKWARELFEQPGKGTGAFSAADAAKAANAAGRQIVWNAPAVVPQQSGTTAGPAKLEFKERPEKDTADEYYRKQASDAELQRTADKVYRLIEDRLRRELRRSGR